jgi:hypothetical protein
MKGMVSLIGKENPEPFLKRVPSKRNGPLSNGGYSEDSCRLDVLLLH